MSEAIKICGNVVLSFGMLSEIITQISIQFIAIMQFLFSRGEFHWYSASIKQRQIIPKEKLIPASAQTYLLELQISWQGVYGMECNKIFEISNISMIIQITVWRLLFHTRFLSCLCRLWIHCYVSRVPLPAYISFPLKKFASCHHRNMECGISVLKWVSHSKVLTLILLYSMQNSQSYYTDDAKM